MIRNLWLAQFFKEFVQNAWTSKGGHFFCSAYLFWKAWSLFTYSLLIIRQPVAATLHFLVICIHERTCGWPMVCAAYLLAR
jgi:hypothetical protein